MRVFSSDTTRLVLVFLVMITIKAVGLWAYGPIMTPDSSGYTAYADIILRSTDWLTQEEMRGSVLGFRSVGYPLVLAAMKVLGGDAWMWLAVGLQLVVSLTASVFVYRLALTLSGQPIIALFAAFCHGVGQAIVLDQCILTDSLNASLLLILSCHMGLSILARRKPSIVEVVLLSCMVVAAFLIREAGNYLQFLLWPLIMYWGVVSGAGAWRAVMMVVVFAAPMVMATQAYKSWNEFRTGDRFITTGAQTTMFFPALGLEKRGIHVFAEHELFMGMEPFGPWNTTTPLEQVKRVSHHLTQVHGFNEVEMARYGMSFFFQNWLAHPVDMALVTAKQMRAKQSVLAFMPVESVVQLGFWATGERPWPAKGTLWKGVFEEGRFDQLALVFGRAASRGISMLILLAFLAAVPLSFLRQARLHRTDVAAYDVATSLMFLYWLLYLGYTSAYGLVHLEMRYLMPVEPLSMVSGLVMSYTLWKAYRQRRAAKKTAEDGVL